MALSIPTTPPDWASSVTGLARRIDPSAIAPDGYDVGDRPASAHWNYVIGILCDFAKYLRDPDIIAAPVLVTTEADVRHAVRTYRAVEVRTVSGFAFDASGLTNQFVCSSGGAGSLVAFLPLEVGQRLKEVRVYVQASGGAASDLNARLVKSVVTVGAASSTDTVPVGPTNSVASTNIQKITLTPTADTITTGEIYSVRVGGLATSGDKIFHYVEYDVDRP